jgi:hypothetical protein
MGQQQISNAHLGAAETQTGVQRPAGPEKSPAEIAEGRLSLLKQLETSLQASQRALLSGDLAALQHENCEQLRLQRALEACWPPNGARTGEGSPKPDEFATSNSLRVAQMRILQLGRVQAAILARANRWLTTVSHLLAGPEAAYTSPAIRWLPPCSPSRPASNGVSEG